MTMTKLEAVNVLLRKLNNRPVNSLDTAHPRVPSALAALERHSKKLQAKHWWFNVEHPTLTPQVGTLRITLPGDTLSVDSVDRRPRVAARGRFLYNLDDSTFEFFAPLTVRLHRVLDFELLPPTVAEAVLTAAALEWIGDNDGDEMKVRLASTEAADAYATMHAEHIRNSRRNLLSSPSMRTAMAAVRGYSPAHWEQS